MKKLSIIIILLIALPVSAADQWTKDQIIMQGLASALKIADWGMTLDIADNPDKYREINPILGEHPSRGRVNTYFAVSLATQFIISHFLHSKWRSGWLAGNIMISACMVENSYRVGLRVNF